ncbi:MAG: HK97 family phage prohead protease [Pseudobutyrivibrio sp.]|nr:HK97 family phage prohead protease [Pseudobutyrivibrio sp.]
MLYKELDVSYLDDENGSIEGYASTWIREPDAYGDIVRQGAFLNSLEKRFGGGECIPFLWAHKMDDLASSIGIASAEEDEKGLHFIAKFDATPEAQKVRNMYKDGRLKKFSFAYNTLDSAQVTLEDGRKANELREVDLFEISAVMVPANEDAAVVGVKEANVEVKACRRNNKKDLETINQIIALAKSLLDDADVVTEEPETGEDEMEANACKPRKEAEEQKSVNPEEQERLLNRIKSLMEEK